MDIVMLQEGQYRVAALTEKDRSGISIPALDFLESQSRSGDKAADGFRSLFELYSERGRQGVTADQFHEVDSKHNIWRFRKGRLRIYCFRDPDERSLILLTQGALKKSQRTDKADVQGAVRMKERYLDDKLAGLNRYRNVEEIKGGRS